MQVTQIHSKEEHKVSEHPVKFSAEFKKSLRPLEGIEESEIFDTFIQKEEITCVIFLNWEEQADKLRFLTTSNDGFIKLNEIDMKNNKFVCKKSLYVCQNGITAACKLSGDQSFALAGNNNSIYIFSFQTGTCINEFVAHDDYITGIMFHDAKLVSCSMD